MQKKNTSKKLVIINFATALNQTFTFFHLVHNVK